MNDELDRRLSKMPQGKLSVEQKQIMHDSIMNYEPKTVRKTLAKTKWILSTVGGFAVVALLALFILTLPQNPFMSHAFLAADELKEIEELKSIERPILLPTYAPFEIDEVEFDQQYRGPQSIENGEMVFLEPDNPKYHMQNFYFRSNERPMKMIHVTLQDSSVASMGGDYEEIEFDNGRVGHYMYNGSAQFFYWIEKGVLINVAFWVENKDKTFYREGPIPKEEIIKIAESFEVYNK